jgi:hypothetical protein
MTKEPQYEITGRQGLFNAVRYTDVDFYDYDTDCTKVLAKSNIDFSQSSLPSRTQQDPLKDQINSTEVTEVTQASKSNSMVAFDRYTGREDNLIYRSTEETRRHFKNQTTLVKVKDRLAG